MFMCKRSLAYLFLFGVMFAANVIAAEYNGTVQLTDKGNAAAPEEYADVVIYFIPAPPMNAEASAPKVAEVRMENKGFMPRVLPITAGTQVDFPNFDPILHNAFSTSTNNSFDLGFYGGGEKKSHAFDRPGLVRIYCNVHHSMVGYILVLNTPHYTSPSSSGEFVLKDLPTAPGELYLWHPRADVIKRSIDLAQPADQTGVYPLDLTQLRIPKHLNKEGKSYRRSRERSY